MPKWAEYILYFAAVVTALGALWVKLIRPLAHLITLTGKLLPLVKVLTTTFEEHPDAFKVLAEIAAEFRTNDGSSLKDAVDRIEEASTQARLVALEAKQAADELKIGVEARRLMAEQDRKNLQELFLKLDRVSVKVDNGVAAGERMEHAQEIVAEDLAAAHRRADESAGEAGAAADAAVTKEKTLE